MTQDVKGSGNEAAGDRSSAPDAAIAPLPNLEPVQLLAPDGTRLHHDEYDIDVDAGELNDLYRSLVITRTIDREFVHLQRQGELALYAPCEGQEAASIGLMRALRPTDWVFIQYRELGMMLERGVPYDTLGQYWRGDWHTAWDPNELCLGPFCIPIATNALHATGYAMGVKLDGGDDVVVACLGDGATSEGDTHEAMNFASVFDTPTMFYVQNNQWAISTPLHEQFRSPTLAHKAVAYGMTGVRVDGNDILAVMAVVRAQAESLRNGAAPVLVEAVTYRMGPHTTSDDPSRYRTSDESAEWILRDPIDRLERHLRKVDIWADTTGTNAADEAKQLALELRKGVLEGPEPDPLELFDHVFDEATPNLISQAHELAAELEATDGVS